MVNKSYITCSITENPDIFSGYYKDYSINDTILSRLARDLGFYIDMYSTLSAIDSSAADKLVLAASNKSKHTEISLLVNLDTHEVLGYSLDPNRLPLLNTDFMKRVSSLSETSQGLSTTEAYLASDDTKSSIILKKVSPITVDLGSSKSEYQIGVLVVNDELDSAYCRLVVFIENQPIYLPAAYYNSSTNRYRKSTGDTAEALEVMILRVIDDLRGEDLVYKMTEFHMKYRVNKDVLTSYEEYNTLLRTMMKIPTIIDDRSELAPLQSQYDEFENSYSHIDDQKSSYIWRCTAIGDLSIGQLVHITSTILNNLGAPAMEYYSVRELLGNYLCTNRIVAEIAKEDA